MAAASIDRLIRIGDRVLRDGRPYVLCRCRECGHERTYREDNIAKASAKPCNCAVLKRKPETLERHGMGDKPEYTVWRRMRQRCLDPNCKSFPDYGGRGITICPEWDSFEQFFADMGSRPSPKHEIERSDNNGQYMPSNCRWATRSEQGANKRNNIMVDVGGERVHLAEACRRLGVDYHKVRNRMWLGYSPEDALYGRTKRITS
jgi:hypothetical protein